MCLHGILETSEMENVYNTERTSDGQVPGHIVTTTRS
jgi:hypothetical protein